MIIQNTQPVVIAQVEEKSYPHFWISRIIIEAPKVESGRVHIELSPYNSETKEILHSSVERIHIEDIWSAAEENLEIRNAISSIIDAVNVIKNPQN
jgi:hypothetical protein